MNIHDILRSGLVKRYHVWPTTVEQNVSAHSWGVAQIYLYLAGDDATMPGLRHCLDHDCAEIMTGDTPAHVKWRFPELKKVLDECEDIINKELGISHNLAHADKRIVKTADMLELMWWSAMQVSMGNSNFLMVFRRGATYLSEQGMMSDKAYQLTNELTVMMKGERNV